MGANPAAWIRRTSLSLTARTEASDLRRRNRDGR